MAQVTTQFLKLQINLLMNKKSIIMFAAIAITSIAGLSAFKTVDNYFELSKNLEILNAVVRETNTYYVDEIEPAQMLQTGIDAMLKSLDPYTNYYSESEIEDYRFMTTGQYGGIGAIISQREDYVMIAEPYEGYPAEKAGLMAGDIIRKIDNKSVEGKSTSDISDLLKGEPNTEVALLIERQGAEELMTIKVIRKEVKVKNVPYSGFIEDNIGYIKFSGFRTNAAEEVKEAVLELQKTEGVKGIVLDLRGNPGGLLHEAIEAVNLFVPKGQLVVSTKGKVDDWNKEYFTSREPVDTELPIVVLIDAHSASASEIVSGSLQDLDRAVVIGRNSFGKGLVQTTRPLPYNAQMKITTSKYYIPSGRCIQAIDYSNKDEAGKGIHTIDSLRRPFKTMSGRTVFDGNGIAPDIDIEGKEYADVVLSLLRERLFFDYATHYKLTHSSIPDVREFDLNNEDFDDFLKYLSNKSYEYKTESEEALEKLIKSTKDDEYYAALETHLDDIQKQLKADKQQDVRKHKRQIMEILEDEIASRYEYQAGRIKADFDDDKDILKAVELLKDIDKYHTYLVVQ